MQIKRFEAKNMSEALRLIKKELGPDAVLLSARSLKKQNGLLGNFRKVGVEVTAAIDNPRSHGLAPELKHNFHPGSSRPGTSASNRSVSGHRRRSAIQSYRQQRCRSAETADVQNDMATGAERTFRVTDHRLYRYLISQDVSEDLAAKIVSVVETRLLPEQTRDDAALGRHFVQALEKIGVQTESIDINPACRQVAVFMGLSGVGKTSTIVKLASRMAMTTNARIALLSLDNQRIAGTETLKITSGILQLPFAGAANHQQFTAALKTFGDVDLILVDTPALMPNDPEQIQRLRKILNGCKQLHYHLVCSATTGAGQQLKLLQCLKGIAMDRMVITKIDEAFTRGSLIDLPARLQLPISALSNGQSTTDRLLEAGLENLAALVLYDLTGDTTVDESVSANPKKSPDGFTRPTESLAQQTTPVPDPDQSYFVANSNSDVYHIPDCRWTKMIKDENIIVFASIPEAENKHFKPCRSCCPVGIASNPQGNGNDSRRRMIGNG